MKFQVPQFIEVEDKIFGPLTLKQFIYIAGGVGISVILYFALPLYLSVIPILFFLCFGGALAFFKVNSKPFINFLESAFMYALHPKLYIWQQEQKAAPSAKVVTSTTTQGKGAADPMTTTEEAPAANFIPKLSDSKLRDMTWSLDTKGSLGGGTEKENAEESEKLK